MSCRQTHRTSQSGIALLPQFNVPPGVTDFALENRPPHLPDRNSPSKACILTVAACLCIIGSYSTVSVAAEPVITHTTKIARGVSNAVGRAISHANEEAERNAQKHYEAREKYFERRRLSSSSKNYDDEDPVPEPREIAPRKQSQSALLLRMAALLKTDTPGSSIDYDAVEQFFPRWRETRDERWNQEEVLKDLVLAVSQLAHTVSIDSKHTKALPPPPDSRQRVLDTTGG